MATHGLHGHALPYTLIVFYHDYITLFLLLSIGYFRENHGMLLLHQTAWQRELLAKFGEQCLLDATYNTSMCELLLFFLAVPTNFHYMPVAAFLLDKEDSNSIAEAIALIKANNPRWKPEVLLMDFDEREISGIELNFPGKVFKWSLFSVLVDKLKTCSRSITMPFLLMPLFLVSSGTH